MDKQPEELRILILEDVPADAELEEIELQNAELMFSILRVDTRKAFERALDEFKPDVVLADYKLPAYSGRDALEYAHSTHPHIPVIMVTGALGDEAAVELLKQGAMDYVLKDRLVRLAPAIRRALSEEREIREREIAERKYRALFAEALDGIVLIDCMTEQVSDCNPEFERLSGRTLDELKTMKIWALGSPEQLQAAQEKFLEVKGIGSGGGEFDLQKPDGSILSMDISAKLIRLQNHDFIQAIVRDISGRKRTEAKLRESEEKHRQLFERSRDALMTTAPPSWKFSNANAATLQLFGANSLSEFTELGPWDVSPEFQPDGQPSAKKAPQMIAIALRDGSHFFEWAHQRIGGAPFPADVLLTRTEVDGQILIQASVRDISGRKRTETALLRANRALKTLSACNLALVRAASQDELLREVTGVIVEQGGYRLAMVSYAGDGPEKPITLQACSGSEANHCWEEHLSWADTEQGQLPVSQAIRSGTTQICRDITSDPAFMRCRNEVLTLGYVSSIALPLADGNHTFGGLSIYSSEANAFDVEEIRLLEELANGLAYGIITLRTRAAHDQHAILLRRSLEQFIQAIAGTLEVRDPYTAGHQRRVGELATAIAQEMGLSEEQTSGVYFAAIIHDLGKIRIPAEILVKPGRLTDIEFMFIKTHSQVGYDILKDVRFPWPIADIILQHHERLDGSGYPHGLKDGQLLLESKIIAVADVVEAMSSHRPYRPALGTEAALAEIVRGRGSLYDQGVVDVCLKLFIEKGFGFSKV